MGLDLSTTLEVTFKKLRGAKRKMSLTLARDAVASLLTTKRSVMEKPKHCFVITTAVEKTKTLLCQSSVEQMKINES